MALNRFMASSYSCRHVGVQVLATPKDLHTAFSSLSYRPRRVADRGSLGSGRRPQHDARASTPGALVEVRLRAGGYGPPIERDAELNALDRLEGYAS